MGTPTPFRIDIAQDRLDDLARRLAAARLAPDIDNADWGYGTNHDYLAELLAYWRTQYDWRAREARMNAFEHHRVEIDGIPIHFMRRRGKGPRPLPIVLSHGWPWTFWDFQKVVAPLTDPAAHGGAAQDAFDVVVPSLPGFGFSSPLTVTGINYWRTADLWLRLMRDVLGYDRFAAQGGDWGGLISMQLGHKYPQHLLGVHLSFCYPLGAFLDTPPPASDYAPEEPGWYERTQRFFTAGSGYSAIQITRPQTLAYALHDSPLGLAAWLVEKRRAWSACGGEVERCFSKDELLDTVMLYWLTDTFFTSARYYAESVRNPWRPAHEGMPVVSAPTAYAEFPGEIIKVPRAWAQRYCNLQRWTSMPAGGHFAPMEQPELLVEDVRAFFRGLR